MILNGPGISYTEPDIGSEFVPPLPEHPREAIVKLCEHCTNRLLHRDELLGYEYWSFAEAATDEQAEVLCKMKMRRPYTLPEMVKLTGMPEADIEKMLDDMSYTGLLEYNWENPERAKQWVLPMLVPGSAEFLNMRVSQLEEHPVYAKFFEQASKGPLSKATPMVPPGGAGIGMHVIPVEKAIDATSTSVPIEHIEHWLDKYEGKYAASTCSCRASRRVMGEGCADDPADWCIAVGDMADYVVETDRGHYVTRDEVYDILRQAEDNGFVHQITNIDGENKIFAICNCNVNVCYALRTSQLFNTPNLSRSAYVAKVEKDKCVACGRCVEVCPAGAAKLGQKLCSKKAGGQVPEYPRQELPDATKWDHTKWSPNYRNDNRIETHESGTAPCKTACPAHVAVQGYLKLAAQGRYDEALAHRMVEGGDAILVPSRFEPCGLTQMYGLRFGTLPVVSLTGGLADTVINASAAAIGAGVATGLQFHPVTAQALARTLEVPLDRAGRIQVEYVSANPTGPLHVGLGRGAAAGSALVNLLRAAGYDVESEYYINDAGNQMNILAASVNARYLELLGKEVTFPENGYHGADIIDTAKRIIKKDGDTYLHMDEAERLSIFKELALKEKLAALGNEVEGISSQKDDSSDSQPAA